MPLTELSSAIPTDPLWTIAATPPRSTCSGNDVPNNADFPVKFSSPRQFGPQTAISLASATSISAFWAATPSCVSPKPLDKIASAPAFLSAACFATSTTDSA